MLTGTARNPTDARNFVLHGVAASLGLFGLLRSGWIEAHVVLPFTRAQGGFAVALFGAPKERGELGMVGDEVVSERLNIGGNKVDLGRATRWRWLNRTSIDNRAHRSSPAPTAARAGPSNVVVLA